MTARSIPAEPAAVEGGVGQVFIDFEVVNSFDLDRVQLGQVEAADVRSLRLSDVLMGTGATHLCLPESMVRALGLTLARTVEVATATGASERRTYRNALIRFQDREAWVEAIELPDGVPPLLGAVPMRLMGIQPDFLTKTVRVQRMDMEQTYITAF